MFGVDDMLIGSAISGIGSLATNLFNSSNVEKTNEANAKQAQMNRDFQERMSNTAYQRGMVDMRAAGLNPILAYQKGGASSPSGSQAALTAPRIEGNPAGEAVNTGLALRAKTAELANLQETNKNIQADTNLKNGQTVKTAAERSILQQNLSPAELAAMRANLDKEVIGSSAGGLLRKSGTTAEEAERTVSPLLNSAKKLSDTVTPWKSYSTTSSGSSWKDKLTGENHYQDSTFKSRWPHN